VDSGGGTLPIDALPSTKYVQKPTTVHNHDGRFRDRRRDVWRVDSC
jgi:hypothetical protein